MDSSPVGVSSSTMRSEMRVLPVPQGRMILPRAWPVGRPPLSDCSCSLRMRTLSAMASACMQDLDCRRSSPSGSLQWGHSSSVNAPCCCTRSLAMLMTLMGRDFGTALMALRPNGLSPLVTIHLSDQKPSEEMLAKLSISGLSMLSPRPLSSSCRDLHCMATYSPSRLTATTSIPVSCLVDWGCFSSRSGHSPQCQHCAMFQSLMNGPTSTVRFSSHFSARRLRVGLVQDGDGCFDGGLLIQRLHCSRPLVFASEDGNDYSEMARLGCLKRCRCGRGRGYVGSRPG